jgi:hypothetical protein
MRRRVRNFIHENTKFLAPDLAHRNFANGNREFIQAIPMLEY